MNDTLAITRACGLMVDKIQALEKEQQQDIMLNIPARVMLCWIPPAKFGTDALRRQIDDGLMDNPELAAQTADSVYHSIKKVLEMVTYAITENDPFKTFNLKAELEEVGVIIEMDWNDGEEDG
jgi:hypothetical protein